MADEKSPSSDFIAKRWLDMVRQDDLIESWIGEGRIVLGLIQVRRPALSSNGQRCLRIQRADNARSNETLMICWSDERECR
jgi:hypothetical protein